jgi:predicted Zn-dependent protease
MIGHTRLLATLATVVKRTKADGVSVCAQARTRRVFRFAHEAIHQDLAQESVNVTVKVIANRRVGVSSADTLEPESLKRCVRSALEIAKHSPAADVLPPLPAGQRIRSTADHVAATARVSPASSVAELKRLYRICRGAGAQLAGSIILGEDELAVVNSAETSCYAASTVAGAKLVTMYRKLSGFASGVHRDVTRLNLDGLLKRSLGQSLHRL